MEFKYWGLNIVRGIQVCRPTPRRIPYPRPGKNALSREDGEKDPFLYRPSFQAKADAVQTHLVANETAYFLVTLANPFAFDLDIQNISVSADGVGFTPNPMSTVIPANTSVTLRVSGTPTEAGDLSVRGCKIKVHGCLEQEFCVYLPPDADEIKKKEKEDEYNKRIKKCGLAMLDRISHAGSSQPGAQSNSEQKPEFVAEFLKVPVIVEQPLIKIKSTSLMHGAVMLFEGEKMEMTMRLENVGKIPVDYISLSFQDSTIENTQAILKSSDIPAEEAYEMELFAHKQPVFSWEKPDTPFSILPAEEFVITIKLFGKRGCVSGMIQIDYGYINRPNYIDYETFYTRQVYYPVLLTIHQNLEPVSMDILNFKPLNGPDNCTNAVNGTHDIQHNKLVEDLIKLMRWNSGSEDFMVRMENNYCLLTFDIRNLWHSAFNVTIESDEGEDIEPLSITTTIQPAATARKIALCEREYTQPIPSSKQFVVSKGPKGTVEQEKLQLALFWYRENLLKKVKAIWESPSTNQKGVVDIRTLRLNKSMLSVLKVNDVSFGIDIEKAPGIEAKSSLTYTLPICFFSRGDFKFLYHCEDVNTRTMYFDTQPLVVEVVDK
ncbi:1707_t:CDS:10 [Racocetra persica]|uniref:1707_t:CDS:1 n=1 Tax=Racocetra persica TaxID=160502 RepID=A0ACA9KXC4_9GLOM|nr:1707_t:CDS:10 [Racocetra persica]